MNKQLETTPPHTYLADCCLEEQDMYTLTSAVAAAGLHRIVRVTLGLIRVTRPARSLGLYVQQWAAAGTCIESFEYVIYLTSHFVFSQPLNTIITKA